MQDDAERLSCKLFIAFTRQRVFFNQLSVLTSRVVTHKCEQIQDVGNFLYNYGQAHYLQHFSMLITALLVDLGRVDVAQIVPESGKYRHILSFDLLLLLLHTFK